MATPKIKNLVVSQSMKIWLQIRKYFKWHDRSTLAPIIHNHEVTPSFCNNSFSLWVIKGIHSIQILYIQGIFASFDQLREKYAIANSEFFKYLQIRSFIKTSFPAFPSQPPNSEMDTILLKDPHKKGSISRICELLLSKEHMPTLNGIKEAWQQDIGLNITASQWTKALNNVHSSSICARHGLLQFKILHRLHFSKVRLSKMFPGINSACDRCGQDQAMLAHTFWSCPNIVPYWIKIFDIMSDVCQVQLCLDPVLVLFE